MGTSRGGAGVPQSGCESLYVLPIVPPNSRADAMFLSLLDILALRRIDGWLTHFPHAEDVATALFGRSGGELAVADWLRGP